MRRNNVIRHILRFDLYTGISRQDKNPIPIVRAHASGLVKNVLQYRARAYEDCSDIYWNPHINRLVKYNWVTGAHVRLARCGQLRSFTAI